MNIIPDGLVYSKEIRDMIIEETFRDIYLFCKSNRQELLQNLTDTRKQVASGDAELISCPLRNEADLNFDTVSYACGDTFISPVVWEISLVDGKVIMTVRDWLNVGDSYICKVISTSVDLHFALTKMKLQYS